MGDNDYKRKWQIALRRYIIESRPAFEYAPYFGISNAGFRDWIEASFKPGMNWLNFGKAWQIDHVVPVSLFNHENESELRLCWNFINIHPTTRGEGENKIKFDVSNSISYFNEIYTKTSFYLAAEMVEKLKRMADQKPPELEKRVGFLNEKKGFLNEIKNFGNIEMELINKGLSPKEALAEAKNIRRLSSL